MHITCPIHYTPLDTHYIRLLYSCITPYGNNRMISTESLATIIGPKGGVVSFPIYILLEYLLNHGSNTPTWLLPSATYPPNISSFDCYLSILGLATQPCSTKTTSSVTWTPEELISLYHTCKSLPWCRVTEHYIGVQGVSDVGAYECSKLELTLRGCIVPAP